MSEPRSLVTPDAIARHLMAELKSGRLKKIGAEEVEAAFNASGLGGLSGRIRDSMVERTFRRFVELAARS